MRTPAFARVLFVGSLFFAWMSVNVQLVGHSVEQGQTMNAHLRDAFPLPMAVSVALTLLFVTASVLFVMRRWEVWTGGLVVAMLAGGATLQDALWPGEIGENHAVVLPGVAVLAYLIGRGTGLRRGMDRATAERLGYEAACGVAAACYLIAGLSKVHMSGLAWASGSNLSLHMHVHALSGGAWMRPFRLAVAEHLWLCTAFGAGTLLIECGAVVYLWAPLRRPWSVLIGAMHTSIGLLMGLYHPDWMLMALALGFYDADQPLWPWRKPKLATIGSPPAS